MSPASPAAHSRLDEAPESLDSTGGSNHGAASLSAATVAGDDSVSDRTSPACATSHSAPGVAPATPVADPPLGLFCEGCFDASASPGATRDHPLITIPWDGCPYLVTSYRDDDDSSLDSSFGVQVHHPRFLEWVGRRSRPACSTGHRRSGYRSCHGRTRCMQRCSFSAMSSNLTVLHQYAISLHRTATDLLHSVFCREFFPYAAVNDAAPVPRVLRASAHLAAIHLWRPPVGLGGSGLDTVHQGPQCSSPLCRPRPSGWQPVHFQPVCQSVCLSVTFSFRTVTRKDIDSFSRNFAGTCTMSWECTV